MLTINTVAPIVIINGVAPSITRLVVSPRKVSLGGRDKNSLRRLGPLMNLELTEAASIEFQVTGKLFRTRSFRVQISGGASLLRIPIPIRTTMGLGRYSISAIATDSLGRASKLKRASFRVIR